MDDFHPQSVGDARINARPPRNLTLHALQLEGEDRARVAPSNLVLNRGSPPFVFSDVSEIAGRLLSWHDVNSAERVESGFAGRAKYHSRVQCRLIIVVVIGRSV